jgi:hypothetical protein
MTSPHHDFTDQLLHLHPAQHWPLPAGQLQARNIELVFFSAVIDPGPV